VPVSSAGISVWPSHGQAIYIETNGNGVGLTSYTISYPSNGNSYRQTVKLMSLYSLENLRKKLYVAQFVRKIDIAKILSDAVRFTLSEP
jgi:hypothetical protein